MPAWTWHSPIQMCSLRPVTRSSQRPRNMSGRKRISRSAGIASITALRVAGGAAVVALGLHLGGRVHVRDDDRAGVLRLPLAQLLGRDRRGQRAAGAQIGDQHRLLGREDLRRLGHEVDAAEDDRLGVGRGRLAREAERVADVVGHVLHLGHLVVVGEDHRVALRARARGSPPGACAVSRAAVVIRPPGRRGASAPSGSARRRR